MEVLIGLFAPSKATISCTVETPGETVIYGRVQEGGRVDIVVVFSYECFFFQKIRGDLHR
jgi:hypothetical protein